MKLSELVQTVVATVAVTSIVFLQFGNDTSTPQVRDDPQFKTMNGQRSLSTILTADAPASTSASGPNCVDTQELEDVLSDVTQLFMLSPTKSGGTSMASFSYHCVGNDYRDIGTDHSVVIKNIHKDKPPKLIGADIYEDEPFRRILSTMDKSRVLIVYSYRNELERTTSATRHVFHKELCGTDDKVDEYVERIRKEVVVNNKLVKADDFQAMINNGVRKVTEDGKCIIDEDFAFFMVEHGISAIGAGNNQLLTCKTYDTIEKMDPNVMFMHMDKLTNLQMAAAKKFCPELVPDLPILANEDVPTDMIYIAKDLNGGVEVNEWLAERALMFEWAFGQENVERDAGLRLEGCRRKTNQIEEEILNCPDMTVRAPKFDY